MFSALVNFLGGWGCPPDQRQTGSSIFDSVKSRSPVRQAVYFVWQFIHLYLHFAIIVLFQSKEYSSPGYFSSGAAMLCCFCFVLLLFFVSLFACLFDFRVL